MSRTTRVGPVEGFWTTVESWAASVVGTGRMATWRRSGCRLVATSGPYLDVTGDLTEVRLPARPARDAIGARGVPLPATDEVRAALTDGGVEFREVTRAARYRWTGPALTPVVLEAHTSRDEAVVEAWWEDVWMAWPQIRLGREAEAETPPRRATAVAQIARLLAELGHEPLQRPD